jgi:hypothetical protein
MSFFSLCHGDSSVCRNLVFAQRTRSFYCLQATFGTVCWASMGWILMSELHVATRCARTHSYGGRLVQLDSSNMRVSQSNQFCLGYSGNHLKLNICVTRSLGFLQCPDFARFALSSCTLILYLRPLLQHNLLIVQTLAFSLTWLTSRQPVSSGSSKRIP